MLSAGHEYSIHGSDERVAKEISIQTSVANLEAISKILQYGKQSTNKEK